MSGWNMTESERKHMESLEDRLAELDTRLQTVEEILVILSMESPSIEVSENLQ